MANIETFSNYESAIARLKGRSRVKIGNATELVRGERAVAIAHHGSGIVFLAEDGDLQFTMAGWPSKTTRERISACLSARFGRGVWLHKVNGRTVLTVKCHSLEIDPYGTYSVKREEWDGYEVVTIRSWDYRGKNTYRMRVR